MVDSKENYKFYLGVKELTVQFIMLCIETKYMCICIVQCTFSASGDNEMWRLMSVILIHSGMKSQSFV